MASKSKKPVIMDPVEVAMESVQPIGRDGAFVSVNGRREFLSKVHDVREIRSRVRQMLVGAQNQLSDQTGGQYATT